MRFEDNPDLFGRGMGTGTYGDIECEFCGKVYDGREKDRGDGDMEYSDESISWTTFAGKQVCECCYEIIENEIISRMDDIIPWFTRMLKKQHEHLDAYDNMIAKLTENLQAIKYSKD